MKSFVGTLYVWAERETPAFQRLLNSRSHGIASTWINRAIHAHDNNERLFLLSPKAQRSALSFDRGVLRGYVLHLFFLVKYAAVNLTPGAQQNPLEALLKRRLLDPTSRV